MVVKCEVKFENNPNGVFFAGQVSFKKQIKINEINGLLISYRRLPEL
jgi:hypothetical protein